MSASKSSACPLKNGCYYLQAHLRTGHLQTKAGNALRRVVLLVVLSVLASLLAFNAPASADPFSITLTVDDSSLKTGESATLTATANQPVSATQQIKIYRTDGSHQKSCSYGSVCTLSVAYSTSPRTYVAYVAGQGTANPPPDLAATSGTVTVSPEPWTLTLSTDKTVLTTGETATVTATANQNATPTLNILIYNNVTGQHAKSCSYGSTCLFTTSVSVDPKSFRAYAAPWASQAPPSGAMGTSNIIYVTRAPWSVTLAPDPQGVLTATTNQAVSGGPYLTQIYDTTTNSRIKSCSTGTVCQASSWNQQHEYVAYVGSNSTTAPPAVYAAVSSGWGEVEGLSIDALTLALAAYPLSQICEELTFAQGTHTLNSSVNDQALMCNGAVVAGKPLPQFLADLAAAGLGGASVWWVLHNLTGSDGAVVAPDVAPEPDTSPNPNPMPAPPILGPAWPWEDLSTQIQLQNAFLTEDEADTVTQACTWYVAAAEQRPDQDCVDRPIFASGRTDVFDATQHDEDALVFDWPLWVFQNYELGSAKSNQGWATGKCPGKLDTQDCDEFPFLATEQGGPLANPYPNLAGVDSTQNQLQGFLYGRNSPVNGGPSFRVKCNLQTGTPGGPGENSTGGTAFLLVPLPAEAEIPTLRICNDE